MAYNSSRNLDIQPGYMDGVPVKISEKYKPPKRILLPNNNTQRITLNDLNRHLNYDFQLELSIKERMKELRNARNLLRTKREQEIELINQDSGIVKHHQEVQEIGGDEQHILLPTATKLTLATTIPLEPRQYEEHQHNNNINISDFENDTASPFDQMELKTINDLAELAQVLQQQQIQQQPQLSHHHQSPPPPQPHPLPNGYTNHLQDTTIPNIIKSMQMDLKLAEAAQEASAAVAPVPTDFKPIVEFKPVPKATGLTNPFSTLPVRLQQIVNEVSLMGFPIDRVARASLAVGDDQPKLIEHMIAMSQLLDLGFEEEQITNALMRCDNDRDKALDYLVS